MKGTVYRIMGRDSVQDTHEALMEDNDGSKLATVAKLPSGDKDGDELKRNFVQFLVQDNIYKPVGHVELMATLPSASYEIQSSFEGVYFKRVKPQTDELMEFKDAATDKIILEIDNFWNRKPEYSKLGLMHSRGILMFGPPGTGKSSCLQQVVEMMVNRGDIVFFAKSPSTISEGLAAYRQVEPDRRAVVAFEEADELASYDERTLLQLMDGDRKINNVCYIATTNYIDRMSPRMLRPGRFDRKVMIGFPKYEHRLGYLKKKLNGLANEALVIDMARKTEGMSFGHLRELIAAAFGMGDPVDEVLLRLKGDGRVNESKIKPMIERLKELQEVRPMKHKYVLSDRKGRPAIKPLSESSKSDSISRILG